MKLRNIFLSIALTTISGLNAQQINPITQAVLDGYSQTLKDNPKDYETLYQRAAQYFTLSMYDNALPDIIRAIEYTPAKDKDALMREFALMADINIELKDYEHAMQAVDKALEINPQSYPDLYRKGNIQLRLNDGDGAYRTFSTMQRLKSRSQEAYFGMAQARLLTGQKQEAEALLKEVLKADATSPISFCRAGDLYREMGENRQAAANYLNAFAIRGESDRPLQSMIALGRDDFQSVADAIDYAIERSDNRIPLYFIKGSIANNTGNYSQAYQAFTELIKIPAAQSPAVYASLAEAALAMGNIDAARTNINIATEKDCSPENLLLQSQISLASGNPAEALLQAKRIVDSDKSNADALTQTALASIELKEFDKALMYLNESILADPTNARSLLIRAYVNENFLNNSKAAAIDRNRVATMAADEMPGTMYVALAKTLNGKKIDGDELIKSAFATQTPQKNDCYWMAVYYAQTGDLQAAREWKDRAVALGFSNIRLLNSDTTPGLNLQPIAHLK